jgi:hypothetical protein
MTLPWTTDRTTWNRLLNSYRMSYVDTYQGGAWYGISLKWAIPKNDRSSTAVILLLKYILA